MKVKNIMFSGFAAAIFAGVCGAAEAAVTYELTSKSYVDTELAKKQDNLTAGTGISIENNVVKSTLDLTPFATTTDMQAADQALQGEIDAEATARANADTALENAYKAADKALEDAYKLADTGLQSQIDAVKDLTGNEGVADQISAAVNAEKAAREQADTALGGRITALDTAYKAADEELDGKISAEVTARTNADTALDTAYKAADTAIRSDFATADAQVLADAKADATSKANAAQTAAEATAAAALTEYKNANDAKVNKNIADIEDINEELATMATAETVSQLTTRVDTAEGEIDALQAADTAIRGEFADADTALEEAYKAADLELDGKISAEVTARTNADTAMDGRITALDGAYKAADEELDGKISAEVTARTNADTALDNKISGLSTDLSTAKDDIKAAYEAADAQVLADAKADAKSKADAVKDLVDAENFVSANGILTTKGGYLVLSDGQGNVSLSQVAVVNGDGSKDMITGDSLN